MHSYLNRPKERKKIQAGDEVQIKNISVQEAEKLFQDYGRNVALVHGMKHMLGQKSTVTSVSLNGDVQVGNFFWPITMIEGQVSISRSVYRGANLEEVVQHIHVGDRVRLAKTFNKNGSDGWSLGKLPNTEISPGTYSMSTRI